MGDTLDLIQNLSLLVAMHVIVGFIDIRRRTREWAPLIEGVLFGTIMIMGMMHAVELRNGVIYDGRAVIASLCGLFLGTVPAIIAAGMGSAYRFVQGGDGMPVGVLMIVVAAAFGLAYHSRMEKTEHVSTGFLLWFGYIVQLAMLVLLFMLPHHMGLQIIKRVGWTVLVAYPLTTTFIGRLLADQQTRLRFVAGLDEQVETSHIIFHCMAEGLIATDAKGRIEQMNPIAARLTGWHEDDAIGRPLVEVLRVVGKKSRKEVEDPQGEILRHGRLVELGDHPLLVTRNGRRVPVICTVGTSHSAEGIVEGVVITLREESTDQQAQRELMERERRFRTIVESGQALVWTADPDRLFDYFSSSWLAFTGSVLEREIGHGWLKGVAAEDHSRFLDAYNRAFDLRAPFQYIFHLRRHDGEYRRLFCRASPRLDSDHTFLGYVGHCVDVTDPLAAQERYGNIFQRMRVGLGICRIERDASGMPMDYLFDEANPAFEELVGERSADLLEKPICDAMPAIGTDWLEAYQQVALTGQPVQFEGTMAGTARRLLILVHQPLPDRLATLLVDLSPTPPDPPDDSEG